MFVDAGQLKLVLAVLLPAACTWSAVAWIGLYVASVRVHRRLHELAREYPWWKVAAVSVGAVAVFFLMFEMWFQVPLPKGPLESLLGLG